MGAHAFQALGNVLGVQWVASSRATNVKLADVARDVSLVLPNDFSFDTDDAIGSLERGLLPIAGLTGKAGASDLSPRDPACRLNFFTAMSRKSSGPVVYERLGLTPQPLKFVEFLLEDAQQVVLMAGAKSVVVSLPSPARYALHKLMAYGSGGGALGGSTPADLEEAAQLLARLRDTRAWEVEAVWADLNQRGKGWVACAKRGRRALVKAYPASHFGALPPH